LTPVAGSKATIVEPLAPRIQTNMPSFSLWCSHTAFASVCGHPFPGAAAIVRRSKRTIEPPLLT
jgi:hypothetical protein